jgi:VWFA-related protein
MAYNFARPQKGYLLSSACRAITNRTVFVAFCLTMASSVSLSGQVQIERRATLIFHAQEKNGKFANPDSVSLQVTERGKPLTVSSGPKHISSLRVALLFDSNYHQREVFPVERATAAEMLRELETRDSMATVITFGAAIYSSGDLTNDWTTLKAFVESAQIETVRRNDNVLLYDSMKRAIQSLGDESASKAIIILAEGNDYGSSISWEKLARLAARHHVACYAALFADHSFYGREIRHYGYRLVELAPGTGGRLWEIGANSNRAHQAAQQILTMLDSQGTIEVQIPSDTHPATFHRVKMFSGSYNVTGQTGYFDP